MSTKRRCTPRFVLLLATFLVSFSIASRPALASAPHAPTAKLKGIAAKLDAVLQTLTKKGQFQGSVLVARKGTILLKKGYGWSDFQSRQKNGAGTAFTIGSITKQFTAMAILQLQEQGKLSVKDSICQYVTGCPAAWKPITLHMLLTHTSGIPDYFSRSIDLTRPMSLPDLIALFEKQPLDFPPGQRWSYSNSGYILLGAVVERVSGESWSAYLRQHIFDPLGMEHTGFDGDAPGVPSHAAAYRTILDATPLLTDVIDPSLTYSAGGLSSTVGDLYTWDNALFTTKLASKQSIDAMFTPYVPLAAGSPASYGYGWILTTLGSHKLILHDGSVIGFESINLMAPDDGLTVIVLSNDGTADVDDIGVILAADVLGVPIS